MIDHSLKVHISSESLAVVIHIPLYLSKWHELRTHPTSRGALAMPILGTRGPKSVLHSYYSVPDNVICLKNIFYEKKRNVEFLYHSKEIYAAFFKTILTLPVISIPTTFEKIGTNHNIIRNHIIQLISIFSIYS